MLYITMQLITYLATVVQSARVREAMYLSLVSVKLKHNTRTGTCKIMLRFYTMHTE